MTFVPSALLMLFSATFFSLWLLERNRRHLLWFATAFLSYASGLLCQILLPDTSAANTVGAAVLYTAGTLIFGNGVMLRSARTLRLVWQILAFSALVGAICYFFFIDRSLLIRVYVLNFGLAAIFFLISWHARFLLRGSAIDKVLLATIVLIGLHFIPRTLLTTNAADVADTNSLTLFLEWMAFALAIVGTAAGLCLMAITGADVVEGLRRERNSDALTGVLNRHGLEAGLTAHLPKRRCSDKTCLVICDVDHFKRINDEYGHTAGDHVLKEIAALIMLTTRQGDLVARVGGEEFIVVLRNCALPEAYSLAERMRVSVETMRLAALPPDQIVTCSFGVAEFQNGEQLWSVAERADKHLYTAKRGGRNRVVNENFEQPDLYLTPTPLPPILQKPVPEIEQVTRAMMIARSVVFRFEHGWYDSAPADLVQKPGFFLINEIDASFLDTTMTFKGYEGRDINTDGSKTQRQRKPACRS